MINLTYTLKQHTPILHFQHKQKDATLRASAVKPILDRWLIKNFLNDSYDEAKCLLAGYSTDNNRNYRSKFQNEGFRALEYKMKIVPNGAHKECTTGKCPMYFGDEENVKPVLYDSLTMEIIIPGRLGEDGKKLGNLIDENLPSFFMTHNFGTRATKGYGSFTVADRELPEPSNLYFTSNNNDWKTVLDSVELFYKTIRGGINYPHNGFYFKSMMFAYAKSKGMRWDKKTIKEHLLTTDYRNNQAEAHSQNDILTYRDGAEDNLDFRDMLGLSTDESWGAYGVKIKKSSDNIKRFTSPIIFKPVMDKNGWKVYIVWNELPNELYNKNINIDASIVNGRNAMNNVQNHGRITTLTIPDNISIGDYIEFLFKVNDDGTYKVDPDDFFSIQNQTEQMVRMKNNIINIYEELRENYNK